VGQWPEKRGPTGRAPVAGRESRFRMPTDPRREIFVLNSHHDLTRALIAGLQHAFGKTVQAFHASLEPTRDAVILADDRSPISRGVSGHGSGGR
jgi:hypothetical protein